MALADALASALGAKFSDDLPEKKEKLKPTPGSEFCKVEFISCNEERASGKDVTKCGIFDKEQAAKLLKELKVALATGGSVKECDGGYYLLLQGRHKERAKAFLKAKNFKFKK